MKENQVKILSEDFALRIVKLYQYLTNHAEKREHVMSKQLLRSGTSIGANIAEAEYAVSNDDFIAKLYISLKECNESAYWIRLLHKSGYLTDAEEASLSADCTKLLKMLVAITKKLKEKKNSGAAKPH